MPRTLFFDAFKGLLSHVGDGLEIVLQSFQLCVVEHFGIAGLEGGGCGFDRQVDRALLIRSAFVGLGLRFLASNGIESRFRIDVIHGLSGFYWFGC